MIRFISRKGVISDPVEKRVMDKLDCPDESCHEQDRRDSGSKE
jgi:hypothetical protein